MLCGGLTVACRSVPEAYLMWAQLELDEKERAVIQVGDDTYDISAIRRLRYEPGSTPHKLPRPGGRGFLVFVVLDDAVEDEALHHRGLAEFLAHLVDRVLGLGGARRPCDRRGRQGRHRRRRRGSSADADQAECVPSISRASRSRPASKMRAASCVGSPSERARVRRRKSAVFSFSVTVEPAIPLFLSRDDTLLRQRPEDLLQRPEGGDVLARRSSRPTRSWSRARD